MHKREKTMVGMTDCDALEKMKEHTVGHYTITTSLGVKRFITYINFTEPITS